MRSGESLVGVGAEEDSYPAGLGPLGKCVRTRLTPVGSPATLEQSRRTRASLQCQTDRPNLRRISISTSTVWQKQFASCRRRTSKLFLDMMWLPLFGTQLGK